VYLLFKFVHVTAVIIWVGGFATLRLLNALVARREERAALAALVRQGRRVGGELVLPSALVTLVSGIGMMALVNWQAPLWMVWGFAAILLSVALGVVAVRPLEAAMLEAVQRTEADGAQIAALQHRLNVVNDANIALLLSAVGAMVFKPGL
jgi:uncharacterized membrane protein